MTCKLLLSAALLAAGMLTIAGCGSGQWGNMPCGSVSSQPTKPAATTSSDPAAAEASPDDFPSSSTETEPAGG